MSIFTDIQAQLPIILPSPVYPSFLSLLLQKTKKPSIKILFKGLLFMAIGDYFSPLRRLSIFEVGILGLAPGEAATKAPVAHAKSIAY